LNVTVPVGVPPTELTVAVNNTSWRNRTGLAEEASDVVLDVATLMGPELALILGSPVSVAAIVWIPSVNSVPAKL